MPFVRLPDVLSSNSAVKAGNISALIWTTTPWTLPANKAIAVKDDITYTVVELVSGDSIATSREQLVVAKDRVDHVLSHLPEGTSATTVVDEIAGSDLANGKAACFNLFQGAESPILSADFVTSTSGTGLVHMAPGHGMEDYQVCQKHGVGPAFAPVDAEGKYTTDVFPAEANSRALVGLDVQTDGVTAVLDVLGSPARYLPSGMHDSKSSLVLASHSFTHKNPIDWRTKQPVIVRATAQWFADVSAIQERARASLDDVHFIPDSGKTRLSSFLAGRSQWCISRQRAWGVPIPALYHKESGEACITEESIDHVISAIEHRGTDSWFSDPADDSAWLHPSLEPGMWVRGKDTMDVWFDSGTTWTTLDRRDGKPASDVYVEGTDQHRGWFQSSLLTHVAVQNPITAPKAPYGKLITHGFILDAEGRKMSKSIGNVIAPEQIVDGSLLPPLKPRKQKGKAKEAQALDAKKPHYDSMGPDALRLWAASSDYTSDVSVAVPVLQEVQQALQKYRVTFKWLLGVLSDHQNALARSDRDRVLDADGLTFADQAVLYRLAQTSAVVFQTYSAYEFHKGVKAINAFFNNDLSAFYFEICKDGLYTGSAAVRQRTQGVLTVVLGELMTWLGPVVPHLVEERWEYLPEQLKGDDEVGSSHPLRQVWVAPYTTPFSDAEGDVEAGLEDFGRLSAAVKLAQEEARRAGHLKNGLNCKIEVLLPLDAHAKLPQRVLEWERSRELATLLVVSQAEVKTRGDSEQEDLAPEVASWRYEQSVDVGTARLTVVVLPPDCEKCVRCWKSTAEEENVPCQGCREVLQEQKL